MTATSDERRRVAQALREMETPTWPTLTEAVMGRVATREKVVERLAELVDPTADVLLHTKIGAVGCGACGHIMCWIGDDVPGYCPSCGARLRKGDGKCTE